MAEPVIAAATVSPGHGGQAELVVEVRFENGGRNSVTLDADCARKLMQDCAVERVQDLCGHPWQRLLDVLDESESTAQGG